ncbi:MAG: PLDc N-terminal domain-containing protein, partial [Actinobacteria bacterium]|nr:PLDc N-terminal domain-containing protein [Actinomycetota bacterium]
MLAFLTSVDWPWIWALTVFAVDNIIRIVSVFVVPRNRRPTAGMSWLMAILFLPVPGLILFLIIGSKRLPKHREQKQELINQLVADLSAREENGLVSELNGMPDSVVNAVELGRTLGAQPMLRGNVATICIDYEDSIERMAAAIREAEEFVHIEFYILVHDETTDGVFVAMREAIERGVAVRVLLDHIS